MIEASAGATSPEGQPDEPMIDHEMIAISEDKLEALGLLLSKVKDEWVAARKSSGVERRWMDDLDQYHGRDASTKAAASMMDSAEAGYPITNKEGKAQRSTLYVNITRPKSNAVEARLANMLFPSDDRNWGIKPSPSPELVKAALAEATAQIQPTAPVQAPAGAAPQPIAAPVPPAAGIIGAQPQATATQQLDEATSRCKAMQDEIDDQLVDCQYNGEGRKLLHDVCVIGTGIMKGPIVVNRTHRAWMPMKDSPDPSVYVLETSKKVCPSSENVSPWHVFPDPSCGGNVHNGRGIYEYRNVTSKQLRELSKQPGYLKDKIADVLEAGPDDTPYMTDRDQRSQDNGGSKRHDREQFQIWEYWGEFGPDDLRAAGVDTPDGSTEAVSGCIIFVNQTVIKGFLNPHETGDLPYDFMQCELVDDSPWGYGIPFLMRPSQRALNAAWRQLMDNSGMTVGPQVVMKRKGIAPADGKWEIKGNKVWLCDDDTNPKDALSTFDIPHHGEIIQQIIELAMKFADEEASIPSIAQGEKGNAPDTVGGITILMNSANVVMGRYVKQFDDCITRPHIRRYYDWNMAYSSKAAIKGDFQVDARGSSALLVRDMQAQALLALGQYQGSPVIAGMVNWEAWFRMCLRLQHIDPTDIMKTDAEIAQMSSAPPPPPVQIAVEQMKGQNAMQLQQARSQAELQVGQQSMAHEQHLLQNGGTSPHMAQATARIEQERIRAASAMNVEASRAHAEESRADKEMLIARQNGEYKIEEMRLQERLALLQYAQDNKISLQDAQVSLSDRAMQEKTKRELAAAEIELAASEGDKNRGLDLHKSTPSLVRDTMTTPVTP